MTKKPPKFSVIIPVYSELESIKGGASQQRHFRGQTVQRAIKSIINQQFPDWELILVDDGCSDGITPEILDKFAASDERIKVFHKDNEDRAVARNYGMDRATGEWICWLDCDDEYSTNYLRQINKAIHEFPEYKIFNFGSIIHYPDFRTGIRETYYPGFEGEGHEWFRSGQIGAGSFVFKRDLWKDHQELYRIPDVPNPYEFAAASGFDMRFSAEEPDIENPAEAFTDNVRRHGTSLGNPWGDDFLQFYLLTRNNRSKGLQCWLYVQYPRSSEEDYEHFGETFATGV